MSEPHTTATLALDDADERRDTGAVAGSLLARLATLHAVSGAHALGSIVAGLAVLGRDAAATTADGARIRDALLASRVAANGEALWARLGTADAIAASPPSPVLDDLRNDLALLLAHDLDAVLADIDLIDPAEHVGPLVEPQRTDCVDLVVGLWAYATEIVAMVDALATHAEPDDVRPPAPDLTDGPMLR